MSHFFNPGKFGMVLGGLLLASAMQAQVTQPKMEEMEKRILSNSKVKSVFLSNERETPVLITLKNTLQTYPQAQAGAALNTLLNTRAGVDALQIDKQTKVKNNLEVVEFQQFYKGIKVDRAKYKALVKNGNVQFYSGAYYNISADAATKPRLTLTQALAIAKESVHAKRFAIDDISEMINKTTDARFKQSLRQELADADPKGEIVYIQDYNDKTKSVVRLAYKFNIYTSQPLSRAWVYVDALDGKILLNDPIIKHLDGKTDTDGSSLTSVETRYAGLRQIYVKQISGNDPQNGAPLVSSHPATEPTYVAGSPTWVLIDDTRGAGVETYDLNGVGGLPISFPPAYIAAKSFTDVDNNWTLAEHKRSSAGTVAEAENDDIAWDAHWGAEMVYDYWKAKHNRLSYDGKNTAIKSFIHSGIGYDNAFWNGSVMTYGDGSGPEAAGFKPLTSLDVCGHEIGHGVCSSTSDLIYASESGAMNEALSDIWSSCIEFFAITHIDPSLKSRYQPFYIGEQISANPARPLRRMDSPKAEGNPDTYRGQYWTNVDGCSPSLTNDQCGVHNNSGVLNKWFYLITVGSGAGSGPDKAYAGVDDEINDAVTTGPVEKRHPANKYSVNGLGFDVSEQITFLMETMMSSAATYEEARELSIAAAAQLSGNPCSSMVESVTNAWYAVGVGAAFSKPCSVIYGFVTNGSATTEAATPAGCNSVKTINIPVIFPPNGYATVTYSGSATKGIDYSASSGLFKNPTSKIIKKDLVVDILNDNYVEGEENIVINISLTNAGSNPVNSTYTLTLLDDDVVPAVGSGEETLLSETFTRANGFEDPAGWTEILEIPEGEDGDPTAQGKNQWGIFNNTLSVTGKEGTTGLTMVPGTYNDNSESRTIIRSPLIDARGLSVVNLKFDFTVQGEIDPTTADPESFPAFDYMAVAYSFDGVHFFELNTGEFTQFASLQPTTGTLNANLPAALTNKQFYLAFRWYNDTNAGGPFSVSIDNLVLTGTPTELENDLAAAGSATLGANETVYIYSADDGQVINKVQNLSKKDLRCVNASVEKAGNGTFTLFTTTKGNQVVSDKVIRMSNPISQRATKVITLFFTEAQLTALESATGQNRSNFAAYQVDANAVEEATSSNTDKYSTTYTAIAGGGGMFTFSTGRALTGSFALGALKVSAAKTNNLFVKGSPEVAEWKFDNVHPNPAINMVQFAVIAPEGQKLRLEVVNMGGQIAKTQNITLSKGYANVTLQTSQLGSGTYFLYIKNEKGQLLNTQKFIKK